MNSYRRGLTLSLGSVIQTRVDLYSAIPSSRGTGLHRTCPTHNQKLNQVMRCPEDGGHDVSDWVLSMPTADGLVIAPQEERPQVEATPVMELKPIPAQELHSNTIDGSSIYYAYPDPATTQAWMALKTIIDKGKIAFVCRGALRRGSEKLFRLDVFRGYLVLREVVFPENVRDHPETPEIKLEKGTLGLLEQFLDNLMTSWDQIDTVDRSAEELRQWVESGTTVSTTEDKPAPAGDPRSLLETLEQAVKEATAK